jgi:hypothetical protein
VYARERVAPTTDTGIVAVKHGDFKVAVTTSGELQAKQFVQITAPTNAQQAGAFQMKIQSIVPEGTVVKEGDVVAELDRSSLASAMQDVTLSLQKAQAQFQQAQLDTTLTLSKAREDMRSMELALEEKRIAKEQAVYEAPSIRRQAEIDFEKATRALAQAKLDYKTKGEQAVAKMSEVVSDRQRFENSRWTCSSSAPHSQQNSYAPSRSAVWRFTEPCWLDAKTMIGGRPPRHVDERSSTRWPRGTSVRSKPQCVMIRSAFPCTASSSFSGEVRMRSSFAPAFSSTVKP